MPTPTMVPTPVIARPITRNTRLMLLEAAPIDLRIATDRKSTRLNSSHVEISYAVFCLKKKKKNTNNTHIVSENVHIPIVIGRLRLPRRSRDRVGISHPAFTYLFSNRKRAFRYSSHRYQ